MEILKQLFCICFLCSVFLAKETRCSSDSFYDVEDRAASSLSDRDLEYIRRVTRLADLHGSLLGSYLEGAQLPEMSAITRLNLNEIKEKLVSEEIVEQMAEIKLINPRALDEAYKECRIDYAAFVQPITNNILNSTLTSICETSNLTRLCDFLLPITVPEKQPWGRRMIDAMGKIPEGLVEGKLHWVGGFDFCNEQEISYNYTNDSTGETGPRNFIGQYCRLDLSSNSLLAQGISLPLQLGVCVPNSCSPENVSTYISQDDMLLSIVLNQILNMSITQVYCGQVLDSSTDIPFQVGLAILLCFLIIGIIASIYDGSIRKVVIRRQLRKTTERSDNSSDEGKYEFVKSDDIKIWHRLELVIVGFSWYSNIRKIFNTRHKPDHLPVLNGMRYLTYVWVIAGNTYVFGPLYQECWISANIISALLDLPKKFKFQAIINYHLNTDSFLLISGVLITYWFLKRVERNDNKLSVRIVIHYILHRFWRLFPPMMLTLMFYTCFYRYFADGPLFPKDIGDAGNCRVNWWVDMLMVHNLVRTENLCLTWLFYIPLIFQLHVFFLIALIPLVIKPIIGYVLIGAMFVAHIGATAAIATQNRVDDDESGLFKEYYLTPWCRAGPAIIGLAVGIILHKTKCKINMNVFLVLLGWLVALLTMGAVVFSSFSQFMEGGEFWSDSAHAAYDTLARSAWAVALGWVVIACSTGHGGVIGKFLGWDLFMPLSRLVFISFCTSAMMVFRYVYTNRILLYVHDFHMRYIIFGHLIYVTIMGLFFGLLWHYPASIGIEKAICCKTFTQWIMAGRHPEEFDKEEHKNKEHKDKEHKDKEHKDKENKYELHKHEEHKHEEHEYYKKKAD